MDKGNAVETDDFKSDSVCSMRPRIIVFFTLMNVYDLMCVYVYVHMRVHVRSDLMCVCVRLL